MDEYTLEQAFSMPMVGPTNFAINMSPLRCNSSVSSSSFLPPLSIEQFLQPCCPLFRPLTHWLNRCSTTHFSSLRMVLRLGTVSTPFQVLLHHQNLLVRVPVRMSPTGWARTLTIQTQTPAPMNQTLRFRPQMKGNVGGWYQTGSRQGGLGCENRSTWTT